MLQTPGEPLGTPSNDAPEVGVDSVHPCQMTHCSWRLAFAPFVGLLCSDHVLRSYYWLININNKITLWRSMHHSLPQHLIINLILLKYLPVLWRLEIIVIIII